MHSSIWKKCTLNNYADDNSLAYCDPSHEIVRTALQQESEVAINWFTKKDMLANPDKFQAILLGCKNSDIKFSILVDMR